MFRGLTTIGAIAATLAAPAAALAQAAPAGPSAPAAPAASASPGYVLGSGDRVRITVYGEDRLSGEYAVTSTGDISFPLIGSVKASGHTVADVQAEIRGRLASGYLKDPRVSAEVLTFRPFYVLGEVSRPGQLPYADGLTIRQALAAAGGFTYRAKRSKVYILPQGKTQEVEVDLKKEPGRLIQPGDTIRVGERFF